ncbi:MAG TPA: sigma factor-like helix-turn-helix DNA-binding protein [Nocardioidaceae bacterium]|nr:sigma factor-like helix-turn-helix DNA-binding protein [Nocardioidaceae bacterium]
MTLSWRTRLHPAAVRAERAEQQPMRELFRRHYADLLRLAHCLLGDRPLSEDAVVDAFASLARAGSPLEDPDVAPRHLASAVIRGCRSRVHGLAREHALDPLQAIDLLRMSAADGGLPDTDPGAAGDPSEPGGTLHRLRHRQREVVVCRYHLHLSAAETADLLGVTRGAVTRRVARAGQSVSALEATHSLERRFRDDLRALAGICVTDADVERALERLAVLRRGVRLWSRSRSLP